MKAPAGKLAGFKIRTWPEMPPQYRPRGLRRDHYFTFRIYGDAMSFAVAYQRAVRGNLTDTGRLQLKEEILRGDLPAAAVVSRLHGNRERGLFPCFAHVLVLADEVTSEILAHEAVHVASALLRGLRYNERLRWVRGRPVAPARGTSVSFGMGSARSGHREEEFAYTTSVAFRAMSEAVERLSSPD